MMLDRVLGFTHALRDAGIEVSVGEDIDAVKALTHVPLMDKAAVRAALAATMVKSQAQRESFDAVFDIYFSARSPEAGEDDAPVEKTAPPDFVELVERAIGSGDAGAISAAAQEAVRRFGRVPNSPSGSLYFQYPVARALDLDSILDRLLGSVADDDEDGLARRLRRDEVAARVDAFRREVQLEVRRRVAGRRGPEVVARSSVRPLLEDIDLAVASSSEITELRRAIRPLSRKLATRLALKHKRAARGRLDVRRTVRHSLSTGGVPMDAFYKRRAPHHPELFVLCDISSSVASFARFSLMLVHALSSQFSRVRSFAFIDTIDEVTRLFEHEDFLVAVDRMNQEANVVWLDDNSNYGNVLERFWDRYAADVGPRSTVFILGDARNNNRSSRAWVLDGLRHKAHRVYWLNPESMDYWDSGDSIASEYAAHTDGMTEVRTLRQLENFIERVL